MFSNHDLDMNLSFLQKIRTSVQGQVKEVQFRQNFLKQLKMREKKTVLRR